MTGKGWTVIPNAVFILYAPLPLPKQPYLVSDSVSRLFGRVGEEEYKKRDVMAGCGQGSLTDTSLRFVLTYVRLTSPFIILSLFSSSFHLAFVQRFASLNANMKTEEEIIQRKDEG